MLFFSPKHCFVLSFEGKKTLPYCWVFFKNSRVVISRDMNWHNKLHQSNKMPSRLCSLQTYTQTFFTFILIYFFYLSLETYNNIFEVKLFWPLTFSKGLCVNGPLKPSFINDDCSSNKLCVCLLNSKWAFWFGRIRRSFYSMNRVLIVIYNLMKLGISDVTK